MTVLTILLLGAVFIGGALLGKFVTRYFKR